MNQSYIGDGVYVANLGHQIAIWVDNGFGPEKPIYLEPRVMEDLYEFYKRTFGIVTKENPNEAHPS